MRLLLVLSLFYLSFSIAQTANSNLDAHLLLDVKSSLEMQENPFIQASIQEMTLSTQTIELPSGWSIFSTYIASEGRTISELTSGINDQVILVKNLLGSAFLPAWSFNGIGSDIDGNGFYILVEEACSFDVAGTPIPESFMIPINPDWNLIAFLHDTPQEVIPFFEPLVAMDNLIISKDFYGNAYLPFYDFNSMPDLEPGRGYLLKCVFSTEF